VLPKIDFRFFINNVLNKDGKKDYKTGRQNFNPLFLAQFSIIKRSKAASKNCQSKSNMCLVKTLFCIKCRKTFLFPEKVNWKEKECSNPACFQIDLAGRSI
jgi:hypothetical protein